MGHRGPKPAAGLAVVPPNGQLSAKGLPGGSEEHAIVRSLIADAEPHHFRSTDYPLLSEYADAIVASARAAAALRREGAVIEGVKRGQWMREKDRARKAVLQISARLRLSPMARRESSTQPKAWTERFTQSGAVGDNRGKFFPPSPQQPFTSTTSDARPTSIGEPGGPLPMVSAKGVRIFRQMEKLRMHCDASDQEGRRHDDEACKVCSRWWALHSRLSREVTPDPMPWIWPWAPEPGADPEWFADSQVYLALKAASEAAKPSNRNTCPP